MCSWCWGFRFTWQQLIKQLAQDVNIQYVLGGLARDTDQIMPESMQLNIHNTWKKIQTDIPGTEFNFDFWTRCQPRRATYASCRAVIAADHQDAMGDMLLAIQHAYYLEARNPSNDNTLIDLAVEIGLNKTQFEQDLNSEITQKQLINEFELRDALHVHSFPGLILNTNNEQHTIKLDYNHASTMLKKIESLL